MRRRPMLMARIKARGNNKPIRTIGIVGAHQGAGVTFTALMIGMYLSERLGEDTALLECNNHGDFNRIQSAYAWSSEVSGGFSFHQLTCYKEVMPNQYATILNQNYENIILDLGVGHNTNLEEFLRCSIKIIIGGLAPWNQDKLLEFAKEREELYRNRSIIYLLPYNDRSTIKRLRGKLSGHIYGVPYEKEPTMVSKKTCKIFNSIFTF